MPIFSTVVGSRIGLCTTSNRQFQNLLFMIGFGRQIVRPFPYAGQGQEQLENISLPPLPVLRLHKLPLVTICWL